MTVSTKLYSAAAIFRVFLHSQPDHLYSKLTNVLLARLIGPPVLNGISDRL
jgi:hypothetical protein